MYGKLLLSLYPLYDSSAIAVHCCPKSIIGRDSSPVDTHRNQRVDPGVPSISNSSNQSQVSISVLTAPLEPQRDNQPSAESGYVLSDISSKYDPPSYEEAVSKQNSPYP